MRSIYQKGKKEGKKEGGGGGRKKEKRFGNWASVHVTSSKSAKYGGGAKKEHKAQAVRVHNPSSVLLLVFIYKNRNLCYVYSYLR